MKPGDVLRERRAQLSENIARNDHEIVQLADRTRMLSASNNNALEEMRDLANAIRTIDGPGAQIDFPPPKNSA